MTTRKHVREIDATGYVGDGAQFLADDGTWKIPSGSSGGGSLAYDYSNGSYAGNLQILDDSSDGLNEKIVAGMSASGMVPGVAADVNIELWISQNRPDFFKYAAARLRDGGIAGTVIASKFFDPPASDSTSGHQQEWSYSGSVTPATDTLVVTIEAVAGANGENAHDIWSDTRIFAVHQDATSGVTLDSLDDVDTTTTPPATGQVLKYNGTLWVPAADSTGTGGGGGGGVSAPGFQWQIASMTGPSGAAVKIASSGATSDVLVADMDCSTLAAGTTTEVWVDLWTSFNRPGVFKYVRACLRDGGPTGTVLVEYQFPATGISDRADGLEQLWRLRKVVTPSTGRLCITVGPYTGPESNQGFPDVWSKVRWMQVTQ